MIKTLCLLITLSGLSAFSADTSQRTRSPLPPGPDLTGRLFAENDVHTQATHAPAGDVVVVKPAKVTDVWVAFKTHFDLGYTDTIENVLRKYRENMMESALKVIEQDRQLPPEQRFAWMVPGWPLKHMLGPLQDPARKARIEQAVREGSLAVGAIPFSLHTETEELEDLVRGLGYASQIARQYGRPLPIAAKMTDVPCHSWIWPTLLDHAGVNSCSSAATPPAAICACRLCSGGKARTARVSSAISPPNTVRKSFRRANGQRTTTSP